jgi:hypothetical protein
VFLGTGLFNLLKTKKVKSTFMFNAARFSKEHCFWRFPGFAHLSWYEKCVDEGEYGALVE